MATITVTDLNNAKLDVDHIAEVATSLGATATDRLGHNKHTLQGAVDSLAAFNIRGAWATSTAYAIKDVYTNAGLAYVTIVAHISSSISADLAAGKVTIHQGATREELAASSGSSLVGFIQPGTGAVPRTLESKERDIVSVFDYMIPAQIAAAKAGSGTAVLDNASFYAARNVSKSIVIPAGTFILDNYRPINGEVWHCAGYNNTIIKQGSTTNPALNILSDVTVGQLIGNSHERFGVIGAVGATVAAVVTGAAGGYVIRDLDLDFSALDTYSPLVMSGNCYRSRITVQSQNSQVRIQTNGTYNIHDIFTTGCVADYIAFSDSSASSFFNRVVTEGGIFFGGFQNTVALAVVETWTSLAAGASAITSANTNIIENAFVISVPNSSANVAFNQTAVGGVWLNAHIYGIAPATAPNYPVIAAGGTTFCYVNNEGGGYKIEQYLSAAVIASCTFLGDTSTYSLQKQIGQTQPVNDLGAATAYTLDANFASNGLDNTLMFGAAATATLTLPSNAVWGGREITVFNTTAQAVVSASANIKPMTGAAGTAILPAIIGKWAKLKADTAATNWFVIANN